MASMEHSCEKFVLNFKRTLPKATSVLSESPFPEDENLFLLCCFLHHFDILKITPFFLCAQSS